MKPGLLPVLLPAVALLTGCTSIAKITNLSDPRCHDQFKGQLTKILEEEGETPEAATKLSSRFSAEWLFEAYGPRPFLVQAPSGTDYTLFVEKKKSGCLLRLVEKQKGFTRYTNNLTYINTKALPACACEE